MAEKTPTITPIDGERGPADRYTLPAQGEADEADAAEEKAQPRRKQAAQDKES